MINFGSTTLVFIDKLTKKPVNCPKILLDKLNKYLWSFQNEFKRYIKTD